MNSINIPELGTLFHFLCCCNCN